MSTLMNRFTMFALPSGFTPVSIPISGSLAMTAVVRAMADKPGLFKVSHSRSIGGIGGAGVLSKLKAEVIPCVIVLIQLMLTFLVYLSRSLLNIGVVNLVLGPVVLILVEFETVQTVFEEFDVIAVLFE